LFSATGRRVSLDREALARRLPWDLVDFHHRDADAGAEERLETLPQAVGGLRRELRRWHQPDLDLRARRLHDLVLPIHADVTVAAHE